MKFPAENPYFTGRERLLDALHAKLQGKTPIALTGLPGIGKTETATAYLYRYWPDKSHVFWINADTKVGIDSGFVDIARRLHLPLPENASAEQVQAAVKSRLAEETDWLLVFNNVENAPLAASYYPGGETGHILLTTRPETTGTAAEAVSVLEMDEQEGALLLLRRAKIVGSSGMLTEAREADQTFAKALSNELGGLPLALDQAGAYMEARQKTPQGYMALYQQRSDYLLAARGDELLRHPEPVTVTFSLAFEQVKAASPAAGELLRHCAFLAPDSIPEELFTQNTAVFGEPLASAACDEIEWDAVVEAAARYALMRRNAVNKTLSLHRLVQKVLCLQLSTGVQPEYALRCVQAVNQILPFSQFHTWAACDRLLAQAMVCINLVKEYHIPVPDMWFLLRKVGAHLQQRGQYRDAEPFLLEAYGLAKHVMGPEHSMTAESLNDLTDTYQQQGRYAEAEQASRHALAIEQAATRRKELKPEQMLVAVSLRHLAVAVKSQDRFAEAGHLFQQSLEIARKQAQQDDTVEHFIAQCLLGLGDVERALSRYKAAEGYYLQAVDIEEKAAGVDHPSYTVALNALAGLYKKQNRFAEAEQIYKQLIAIRTELLGPEHPHTANAINNLGVLYYDFHRYTDAEPLHMQALQIRKKVLGFAHPITVRTVDDCLNVLVSLHRIADIAAFLRKERDIVELSDCYRPYLQSISYAGDELTEGR